MSLGGESGRAVLADDRSGTRRVAKTWPGGPAELARLRGRLALVDRLRVGGWPIPAVHSTNCVNGEVSIAWEWVDGEISNRPAPAMVADLLALATRPRPATADPGGTFADWLLGSLREGCDGYCLHDPLRRHGRMARALLHRVRRIGEQTPAGAIPTGGIVHRDLHHRNVLWRDGRIAAVVDWEDAGPGDGAFDLVTLAFGLEPSGAAGAARRAAWAAALRSRPAPVLLAYSAHMALRQVDWSIRHHPDAVDRWLVISQSALDRIDRLAPARS